MYHHAKQIKILIADMDIPSHEWVKEFINAKRYIVESAFTIKEVKQKLSRDKFHLLLLGDPLPDGNSWEELESIKKDHPYLRTWCLVEKRNLKTAIEYKPHAYRIIPKPLRQDDLNGIRNLLNNLDNHYYLIDEGEDVQKDRFGRYYPTLEEAIIKKDRSHTPRVIVKAWTQGDNDGGFIVYYKELVTDFPL